MSVQDFKVMQEERVRRYHQWNEDHKRYLATGPQYDLEMYKRCVKEATDNFQKISLRIIEITKAEKNPEIAKLMKKVQDLEEMKLRFTVDVQLAKQELQDDPSDQLMEKNLKGLQKKLNEITEDIRDALEEIRYADAEGEEPDEAEAAR